MYVNKAKVNARYASGEGSTTNDDRKWYEYKYNCRIILPNQGHSTY